MEKRIRYIYEITNKINGKTYIGQHTVRECRTITSDTYWGSGKIIKEAISKYGIKNFEKRIIISGEFTREEINELEINEIQKQRNLGKAEYNISDGGESPFLNSDFARMAGAKASREKIKDGVKKWLERETPEEKRLRYEKFKETYRKNGNKPKSTLGLKYSEETKKKMSEARLGKNNPSFGKHWFTNGKENIKTDKCPKGFVPGRTLK